MIEGDTTSESSSVLAKARPAGLPRVLGLVSSAWRNRKQIVEFLEWREWRRFSCLAYDIQNTRALFSLDDFYSARFFGRPGRRWYEHEPGVSAALFMRMRSAKSFADIGANLGFFTILAGLANQNARVLTVEMDRSLYAVIKRNIELNGLRHVNVESCAVGREFGEVSYTPHALSFLCKVANESVGPFATQATAPVVRLEDLFEKVGFVPEVIKMDIDGAELGALQGMGQVLDRDRPDLFLEVHHKFLPDFGGSVPEVGELLASCGYRCFVIQEYRSGSVSAGRWPEVQDFSQLTSATGDMLFATADPTGSWLERFE